MGLDSLGKWGRITAVVGALAGSPPGIPARAETVKVQEAPKVCDGGWHLVTDESGKTIINRPLGAGYERDTKKGSSCAFGPNGEYIGAIRESGTFPDRTLFKEDIGPIAWEYFVNTLKRHENLPDGSVSTALLLKRHAPPQIENIENDVIKAKPKEMTYRDLFRRYVALMQKAGLIEVVEEIDAQQEAYNFAQEEIGRESFFRKDAYRWNTVLALAQKALNDGITEYRERITACASELLVEVVPLDPKQKR